jgi:hypothetical protein
VLRTHIGCENGCSVEKPTEISVGKKIIGSGFFAFADAPDGNNSNHYEIGDDEKPINVTQNS